MKWVTIAVTEECHLRLQMLSLIYETPMSNIINEAARRLLRELEGQVSVFDMSPELIIMLAESNQNET